VDWRDFSSATSHETSQIATPSIPPKPASGRLYPTRRPWYVWLIGGCLGVLLLLGAFCGALGGLAVGVYQFVFNEPTLSASSLRTFAVQGAPQVVVTNPAGSVTFAPGEDSAVRIEATSRARDRTEDDARKALGSITLDLRQDGDIVSVVARFNGRGSAWPGAARLVDLLITVPVRTGVMVNQSAGDATVGALTGPLSLHVDAGNIHMTDATFTNNSQVQVGAGNVSIDGALAGAAVLRISIDAGNATLTLPSATAAHIEAWTDAGNLTLHGWPISTRHTSGATLLASGDTRASPQARLLVTVEAGDITIQAR
jgi:hypothetical protein